MLVKVLRDGVFRTYGCALTGRRTVAEVLDYLNFNDDLIDVDGNSAPRIAWECSCMQKVCGACAMVIDGKPGLACATFVDTDNTKVLEIRPLSKFPVIKDLKVDRSIIDKSLREAGLYPGDISKPNNKTFQHRYDVARCLKCGLCLEVCPNYTGGSFAGALFANDAFLNYENSASRKGKLAKEYREHFEKGCSKALSCVDVCPQHLPTLSSISFMNRVAKNEKD